MVATFDQARMAEGVVRATMFASKCVVITDLGTRCLERDKCVFTCYNAQDIKSCP